MAILAIKHVVAAVRALGGHAEVVTDVVDIGALHTQPLRSDRPIAMLIQFDIGLKLVTVEALIPYFVTLALVIKFDLLALALFDLTLFTREQAGLLHRFL